MSQVTITDGIPTVNGIPAVKIMTSFSEKIGLANYSNVEIGPISITRYVEDGDEEHIKNEIRTTARLVEDFLAEERQAVLNMVQSSA